MVQLKVSPCYNGKCYLEKEDRVKKKSIGIANPNALELEKNARRSSESRRKELI